ncbi:hypothetical protein [Dehalococcoides mccartyi]|jgi:hypothetical protein|uniref:hypothetical protein n=1 Tax=Dehalococcoides mccartyi TaxID=61435 RepID=UPI0003C89A30|nr:hypothetical protein [Dehalococcoides mccartyi]AHB14182.1 hypothetical protein GY50_1413 [Dehalococcoides mccartyi GY50]AII58520.1 hypothetical protein X792_07555 [Dehalococcoides mccartyi CG1]APH13132.1 hypothetical protein ASJ33_08155 [Dehalococcoides mccartyi]
MKSFKFINIWLTAVLAGGIMLFGSGCGDAAQDTGAVPFSLDYARIFNAHTSSAIGNDGIAADRCDTFTSDTPVIYFSWQPRSLDVCCAATMVVWFFEGNEIQSISLIDSSTCVHTDSLEKPEGGFLKGHYQVALYIGISEYFRLDFTVV